MIETPKHATMATARNMGISHAVLDKADVIVFNDADTICPIDQLNEAVRLAYEQPGLVYAYDLYVRKTEDDEDGETLFNVPSLGCAAISAVGTPRFDEAFHGWGYEDCEYATRSGALWPTRRVSGPVYHLWHGDRNSDDSPVDSDPALVARNEERWKLTLSTV